MLAVPGLAGGPAGVTPPPLPQTPGHHNLFFQTTLNKQPLRMAYAVYLPKDYAAKPAPRPMVVFLNGAGECGNDCAALYVHGPAAEIRRNPELAKWADFLVLSPQCPGGMRWENPGLPQVVAQLVEYAKKSWRVDANRVYLTGLSMGGTSTWIMALAAAKNTFAAIAPICANAVEPDKAATYLKGTTVWIIIADNDGSYTDGSRQMAAKLAAGQVDVVLTEVPGMGHGVWGVYYPNRRFYEFLLLHRRGAPPPKDRPAGQKLVSIAFNAPESVDGKLSEPLRKIFPWWHILNCGADMAPGPRAQLNGRKNVFVTHPLCEQIPCILEKTISVPAGKRSALKLVVGHHPLGDWLLIVRGDGKDLFRSPVGSDTAKNGWLDVTLDLSTYAGRDVRIELLNQATGWNKEAAYWARIDVETAN